MLKYEEIGIDLGSKNIKIARVDKTGSISSLNNTTLNQLKDYKTYPVNCEPYTTKYYQLLKSCIKDFSKTYKLFKLSLNIAIPVDNVYSHINFIDMPVVSEKLISEGVELEAEQKMTMEGIDNSYFTWKIMKEDEELEEYRILLANLSKNIIKSLTQFKTIKWKINRIMLQPVILERIVESNDIILDMGHSAIRVYLYEEGKLSQVEIIDIGGKDILNDVKNYLNEHSKENIDSEDILKQIPVYAKTLDDTFDNDLNYIKDDVLFLTEDEIETEDEKDVDVDGKDVDEEIESINEFIDDKTKDIEENSEITNEEISEEENLENKVKYDPELIKELSLAIDENVNRIIEEIKRIVRMFELQTNSNVNSVFYLGQLSNLMFLKESIEAELELQLKPVDILDINDEQEENNVTLYSIASLISMNAKLKDDTNFAKLVKANIDYSSIIVIALTISLSIGTTFKIVNDKYVERINELKSIETEQSDTMSSLENDIASTQESIDESNNFINKINELKSQKKWFSDILYVIPERTPLTIVIKDLNIEDGVVIIKGYSSDYSSIGFFANKLEDIANVNIDSIEDIDESDTIYSVTMNNPDLISDKYIAKYSFQIMLPYEDTFLEH